MNLQPIRLLFLTGRIQCAKEDGKASPDPVRQAINQSGISRSRAMSQSFRRWLLPLVAASTLFSPVSAQTLNCETQGRIGFASFTPRTMFDLVTERRQNWADPSFGGELSLPKTACD